MIQLGCWVMIEGLMISYVDVKQYDGRLQDVPLMMRATRL